MSITSKGLSREERHVRDVKPKVGSGIDDIEPLVVKPRLAWRLLNCSNTRGYELLNAGELESFKDGKSRKITLSSIKAYIARRLAVHLK
jgi:excisionase family DNA binding protein